MQEETRNNMSLQKKVEQIERNDIFQVVTVEKCVNFGLNCRTRGVYTYKSNLSIQTDGATSNVSIYRHCCWYVRELPLTINTH